MKKTNLNQRILLAFPAIFLSALFPAFAQTGYFPSAYNYPSNALSLEIPGVSNNAADLILHGTQLGVQYEILSKQNLTDASWTSAQSVRGSANASQTGAAVAVGNGTNSLFFKASYQTVGGLALWLGADLGLAATNSSISQWPDQSGNTNNASQNNAGFQPLYITNDINGRPALRFNGTSDLLNVPFYAGTNDFTIFIVAQTSAGEEIDAQNNTGSDGDDGEQYALAGQTTGMGYTNGDASLSIGTNGISVYEYQRTSGGPDNFPPQAVYSAPVGSSPAIVTVAYKAKQPTIYLNGFLAWTGLSSLETNLLAPREIGGDSHGYFNGDIAEVLIFDRALSYNERLLVETYLNSKYGVVSFVPTAPLNLAASTVSSNQVNLTWANSATNASVFRIERKLDAGGDFQEIATVNATTTSYLDSGLDTGTQYDYRVRAGNIAGNSPYSTETNATTSAAAALPLQDLKLWLEADAGANQNAIGQVPFWFDQSGNTNNASQNNASSQPLYIANAINGRPILHFDGTNDMLTVPAYAGTNNFAIFIVARTSAGENLTAQNNTGQNGESGELYALAGQTTTMPDLTGDASLSIGTNGISVCEYQRTSSGPDDFPTEAVYTNTIGTAPEIITVNYTAQQPTIYLNGTLAQTGVTSVKPNVLTPREIGGDSHGYFPGDIAEVLIFDRSLSADEQLTVETYLNSKYAVVPSVPAPLPVN